MRFSKDGKLAVYLINESMIRGLSSQERKIVFDYLEYESSGPRLEQIVHMSIKLSNPSTKGVFRKEMSQANKYKVHRRRPHKKPQRKRGYTDKGSLAGERTRLNRRLIAESLIHISILEERLESNSLRILKELNRQGKFLSGNYFDISRFQIYVEENYTTNPKVFSYIDQLFEELVSKTSSNDLKTGKILKKK